jgi:hypothetical protein
MLANRNRNTSARVRGDNPMSEPTAADPKPISPATPVPLAAGDVRAEDAKQRAASGLLRTAAAVRDTAHHGNSAALAAVTAEALDRAGRYLHDHDVAHVRDELARHVRRRPIEAVLLAAGFGFASGVVFAGRGGRAGDAFGLPTGTSEQGNAADRLAELARRYGVDELVNDAVAALRGDTAELRESKPATNASPP